MLFRSMILEGGVIHLEVLVVVLDAAGHQSKHKNIFGIFFLCGPKLIHSNQNQS